MNKKKSVAHAQCVKCVIYVIGTNCAHNDCCTICIECKINYLCTYDLYSPVHNGLDACLSITRASGRGLGRGNQEFIGPCEMALSRYRRVPFGVQKNLRFPGPNPLPLAQVLSSKTQG
jgi:hypothetical protein